MLKNLRHSFIKIEINSIGRKMIFKIKISTFFQIQNLIFQKKKLVNKMKLFYKKISISQDLSKSVQIII